MREREGKEKEGRRKGSSRSRRRIKICRWNDQYKGEEIGKGVMSNGWYYK